MAVFRLAAHADLPELKALVESAYRGESARGGWTHEADLIEGERITMAELEAMLADPAQRLILALADNRLLGCVCLTTKGNGLAYLGMLAVDPTLQASGTGRRLIAEAEARAAAEWGAATMEMMVISNRSALIAYYERRGYAQTGETRPFPLPGYAHLQMVVLAKAIG